MLELIALFLSGFSTKMLDGFRMRKFNVKEVIYSLVFSGFTLSGFFLGLRLVPELVIGLILALILAGKMDTGVFKAMSALFITVFVYFLLHQSINIYLLPGFLIASFLDELEIARGYRPFLPLFSLLVGFIFSFQYFFAILAFDAGYTIAYFIKPRFISWFF